MVLEHRIEHSVASVPEFQFMLFSLITSAVEFPIKLLAFANRIKVVSYT